MRAGMVLRALCDRFRVSLLVAPLYASPAPTIPSEFANRCAATAVVPPFTIARPPRWHRLPFLRRQFGSPSEPLALSPEAWLQAVDQAFQNDRFDVVHLFRLASLPFARAYLTDSPGDRPRWHLDLDDVESETHRRLAALYRQNGDCTLAEAELAEAARAAKLEDEVLRRFDRVYVCSESDRRRLGSSARAEVRVLPNAVPVCPGQPSPPATGPFTFLFVGTLGYYPNAEGITFFCEQVLPRLRDRVSRDLRILIVGSGGESLTELTRWPEVRLIGPVAELAPWYQQAHAVIVPIRAGGGTRIKVLEAFRYRRPVISTTIGVEGIDVVPDEDVLIGDSAEALATQCRRLIDSPALADRLVANASALVNRAYSVETVTQTLLASFAPRPR